MGYENRGETGIKLPGRFQRVMGLLRLHFPLRVSFSSCFGHRRATEELFLYGVPASGPGPGPGQSVC
ncbi:unnamed protein product [Fusarium fujikuroi]|nr:unnamed protein product [Fusarium fujikuroi]